MLYGRLVEDSASAVSDQARPAAISVKPRRTSCGVRIAYSPAAIGRPTTRASIRPRATAASGGTDATTNATESPHTATPTMAMPVLSQRVTPDGSADAVSDAKVPTEVPVSGAPARRSSVLGKRLTERLRDEADTRPRAELGHRVADRVVRDAELGGDRREHPAAQQRVIGIDDAAFAADEHHRVARLAERGREQCGPSVTG